MNPQAKGQLSGLDGKVAIVTGGGKGIGQSIAFYLAALGAKVVVCSRTQKDVDHTAGVIQEQGGVAAGITADVTKEADVARVVDGTLKVFGKPTLLVNNAGNYIYKAVADQSLEDWNASINVALTAPFLFIKACLPHMREAGEGRIVNVSSLFAVHPHTKNLSGYCAAKAGLLGLTKQLSFELREDKITVNAVCPGAVNKDDAEFENERYKFGEHLLRRDVAEAVGFLVSDLASQISGSTLEVPGGTGFTTKVYAM